MKFRVGDKVKVLRRSLLHEVYWNPEMNKTIGKVYTILEVSHFNVLLNTSSQSRLIQDYYYPKKALQIINEKNTQLLFDFMV